MDTEGRSSFPASPPNGDVLPQRGARPRARGEPTSSRPFAYGQRHFRAGAEKHVGNNYYRGKKRKRSASRGSTVLAKQMRGCGHDGIKRDGRLGSRDSVFQPLNYAELWKSKDFRAEPQIRDRGHSSRSTRRGRPDRWSPARDGNTKSAVVRRDRTRQRPAGVKELVQWANMPPDAVILSLLDSRSGVRELLVEEKILDEKIMLFIKVLATAATCSSGRQALNEVFSLVFTMSFIHKLVIFHMAPMHKEKKERNSYWKDLLELIKCFVKVRPAQARELLPELAQSVHMLVHQSIGELDDAAESERQQLIALRNEYEQLVKLLTSQHKGNDPKPRQKLSLSDRLAELDDCEPDDDFRLLPVEPTCEELVETQPPVIRRNITKGAYKNVHNYLDVQFRLLREDFVRPLREGVCLVRSGERSGKDVRVYRGVTFQEAKVIRGVLIHFAKVKLPKNFKVESSKRLIFGSVICFSADNFSTYFLASVAGVNPEKLRNGLVGVTLLTPAKIDYSCQYTAVESRAFFVSYKYVLKALQNLDEHTLPLAEHIVFAQKDVVAPAYLLDSQVTHYDLRVLLKPYYMKASEKLNELFRNAPTQEPPGELGHLQEVPILNVSVDVWPSFSELGLDQSQRKALHAALSKRLAIIQGPPGTGKTFLGLKITQILLHNSDAWSRKQIEYILESDDEDPRERIEVEVKSPILVLCYTNHALDQFLEGMLSFTNKIIRIGSRSKSEDIQKLQINEYLRYLKATKSIPSNVHFAGNSIRRKVIEAEAVLKQEFCQLEEISTKQGLLSWSLLLSSGVVPPAISDQLKSSSVYRSWMLPVDQPQCVGEYMYDVRCAAETLNTDANLGPQADVEQPVNEEDEDWLDAVEMLRTAENERNVEFDDEPIMNFERGWASVRTFDVELEDHSEYQHYLDENLERNNFTEEQVQRLWRTFKVEQTYLARLNKFCEKKVAFVSQSTMKGDVNVFSLACSVRWRLYAVWKEKLVRKMREKIQLREEKVQSLHTRAQEVKNSEYLHVARQADVVGLTTTGAAQFQAVLQELRPSIVIIEEAAELLEAHVVASLNSSCEHLIMIGDHQQLKPSPTVYQLAKHYGLDTSLFERMINNGVAYETLEYQHRMRPEISSLLVPSIYPNLKDHQSVHARPQVRGVEKSVFFVSHKQMEAPESDDNNSRSNEHEAAFMMRLARHLVLQGYSTDQITVLTPYSGQFFLLRKEQRKYSPTCDGLRIAIVDDFQGEENDIILLSLVRSNDSGKVGFLRIENRVCVALSRAKLGLFIIGNMDQLRQSSDLWVKIEHSLKAINGVGEALVLRCSNHPDRKAAVKTEEDLRLASPEGGCTILCTVSFPRCGHPCPRMCHADDPFHTEGQCRQPCEQKCSKRGHPCPALCYEKCPDCTVKVEKLLECGHSHIVPCWISRQMFKCPSKVEKVIDACGHVAQMPCHQDPSKFKCSVKCDIRLDCGHACVEFCHVEDDPKHLAYNCKSPCTRKMKSCSQDHKCTLLCYQTCPDCSTMVEKKLLCGHKALMVCRDPVDSYICNRKCPKSLECGHHCPRRCSENCGGCTVMVSKKIETCGHTIQIECGKTPTRELCTSKACQNQLPCGHKCPRRCCEPCGGCQETVSSGVPCLDSSHTLLVPCSSLPMPQPDYSLCRAPCGTELQCKHKCRGSCGECFHGRFHLPCAQKCDRVLVCGHVCKSPCSAACPPCQDKCRWQCAHSRCDKPCGVQCTPCQEPCWSRCRHRLRPCAKKCGEVCDCLPCEKPCPKLLKCGHPCVGLCGDPCPPLCRVCHLEELTEFFLLGNENEPDARFVLLEDCGHVIEYEGLSGWLQQRDDAVQMKRCPRCQQPIYNNRRFKNLVLETYKDVQKVRLKHGGQRLLTLRNIIFNSSEKKADDGGILRRELDESLFFLDCILKSALVGSVRDYFAAKASTASGANWAKFKPRQKEFKIGTEKLQLYSFQVDVIKTAKKVYKDLDDESKENLEKVMERVMSQNVSVVRQFMEEVQCELQRLRYISEMKSLRTRSQDTRFLETVQQIEAIMSPTSVFTAAVEAEVKRLLKVCESYVGGLGISEVERLQIVKAMRDVRRGAWYKCPNGHIYCIANCGGAMVRSRCSECGAAIGGANHRLLGDNSVASEMDGAVAPAWPQ